MHSTYLPDPPLAVGRRPAALWWKRPLDLVLGAIALLAALPLVLGLALAVGLESEGPAFFSQERVGLHGRRFRMWKLRTMRLGYDEAPHQRVAAEWFAGRPADGDRYKTLADARITRVGGLLRRTSLDELPQLLNVLLGDMSLVGPRPAIPYELVRAVVASARDQRP
jgi:lipopolysaccharide/colanic/teichoic acid biosynthesis glycosyltransferase